MFALRMLGLMLAAAGILAVIIGIAGAGSDLAVILIGGCMAIAGVAAIAAARRKCPYCRSYVADKATVCAKCGKALAA